MSIDITKLAALEDLLAEHVLSDGELVDHLREAGLPELAHEFERALKRPTRRDRHRWSIVPFI